MALKSQWRDLLNLCSEDDDHGVERRVCWGCHHLVCELHDWGIPRIPLCHDCWQHYQFTE